MQSINDRLKEMREDLEKDDYINYAIGLLANEIDKLIKARSDDQYMVGHLVGSAIKEIGDFKDIISRKVFKPEMERWAGGGRPEEKCCCCHCHKK